MTGYIPSDFNFRPAYYQLTGYVLSFLEKVLKVNINLHADPEELAAGDIILFNHFARFETFIPPYLVYKHTGAMSRTVAAPELFSASDTVSNLLRGLGAVPTDYPDLFAFLATDIIKGHKVVIFPEGGMVKDRRVVDDQGGYSIMSRMTHERRKQHTGSAVIAFGLEVFKEAVLKARSRGDDHKLARWSKLIGADGREKLLTFAEEKTAVVPANITFYPIRIDSNLLERWVSLVGGEAITTRFLEELRIEGNILLKDTDMDIRLGPPACPCDILTKMDLWMLRKLVDSVEDVADAFSLIRPDEGGIISRMFGKRAQKIVFEIRDKYMRDIYAAVSINMSQLTSALIFMLLGRGVARIPISEFHRILYLAIKTLQPKSSTTLHRSLVNPSLYGEIHTGCCGGLVEYFEVADALDLVKEDAGHYVFLPKLYEEDDFDSIRVENPIAVYANELRPLKVVEECLELAVEEAGSLTARKLAELRFDDELMSYRYDKFVYSAKKYAEINKLQTITSDGRPYLLQPDNPKPTGVLLVHGFTASPAEMRPLAERLYMEGYIVLGVRLKGHGTSPWDMKARNRQDWIDSVMRARRILEGLCEDVAMVGFSMGGLLSLVSAAQYPLRLAGVATVCAPTKLRDKAMMLVELVHHVNRLVSVISSESQVKNFHLSAPEHPNVNYRHMPISSLHELDHLIGETERILKDVKCPALVMQSTGDPTVVPESADEIYEALGSSVKELVMIESDIHGIVYDEVDGAIDSLTGFVASVTGRAQGKGEENP